MSQITVVRPVTASVTRRPPRVQRGYRIDVSIAGTRFALTVNVVDGQLSEVHLDHARHGSFGHGMVSTVAVLLNEALSRGMPVEDLVRRFIGTRFEPSGLSDDPEIGWVSSPMDYLARRLAKDFPPDDSGAVVVASEPGRRAEEPSDELGESSDSMVIAPRNILR